MLIILSQFIQQKGLLNPEVKKKTSELLKNKKKKKKRRRRK
jgi:hypothetical protein